MPLGVGRFFPYPEAGTQTLPTAKRVDVGLCQRACPMLRVGEAELSQEC